MLLLLYLTKTISIILVLLEFNCGRFLVILAWILGIMFFSTKRENYIAMEQSLSKVFPKGTCSYTVAYYGWKQHCFVPHNKALIRT